MNRSTYEFMVYHMGRRGDGQRLGQRFVNMYLRGSNPVLFYERDDAMAAVMVDQWLTDMQYTDELPKRIDK